MNLSTARQILSQILTFPTPVIPALSKTNPNFGVPRYTVLLDPQMSFDFKRKVH